MRLIIIGVIMIMMLPNVQATTVELLEHTDRCDYNEHLDIDHCFSKYLVCDNETDVKSVDISFIFKERGKDFLSVDGLGDKLDTEIEYEKKDDCLEVSITGWKNKFIDVDAVLCHFDYCAYEYEWWNTSMTRWELTQLNNYSNPFLINDTYGFDLGTGKQFIWAESGALYAYNDSNEIIYITNNTDQINSFVDEGNGTSYGDMPADIVLFLDMGAKNCDTTTCTGIDRYGKIWLKYGANEPITNASGKIGSGQSFDGDDDQLMHDNDAFWDATFPDNSPIYIAIWVQPEAPLDPYEYLIDREGHFSLIIGTNEQINSYYWYDSGNRCYPNTADNEIVYDGSWYFLEWSHDGTGPGGTIYKNLVNVTTTQTCGANAKVTTNPAYVSRSVSGLARLKGMADNVIFMNRTPSDEERLAIYNNTKPDGYSFIGDIEFPPPPPPPPSIPVTSFIVYKIINSQIPFIGSFLESLTFKSIILFMDRLTVIGNAVIGGNVDVGGDLTVSGSIYNSLTHMITASTEIHTVDTPDTWYNITFNDTLTELSGMNFEDDRTVIIPKDGHYTIHFGMGFECIDNSNVDVAMRIVVNGEGLSLSNVGKDITDNQDTNKWIEHTTHSAELTTGDMLNFQYIASNDCVIITQKDTYAEQPFVAYGYVQEVII